MWNFSNGQCLTELEMGEFGKGAHTQAEITGVACAFDPETETEKMAHVIAVGWNK